MGNMVERRRVPAGGDPPRTVRGRRLGCARSRVDSGVPAWFPWGVGRPDSPRPPPGGPRPLFRSPAVSSSALSFASRRALVSWALSLSGCGGRAAAAESAALLASRLRAAGAPAALVSAAENAASPDEDTAACAVLACPALLAVSGRFS